MVVGGFGVQGRDDERFVFAGAAADGMDDAFGDDAFDEDLEGGEVLFDDEFGAVGGFGDPDAGTGGLEGGGGDTDEFGEERVHVGLGGDDGLERGGGELKGVWLRSLCRGFRRRAEYLCHRVTQRQPPRCGAIVRIIGTEGGGLKGPKGGRGRRPVT